MSEDPARGPRSYRNNDKLIGLGDAVWQAAEENGLVDIKVDFESNNRLIVGDKEHEFSVLCSCSYLGLNAHPVIVEGAARTIREIGATSLSMAEIRVRMMLNVQLEESLRDLFGCPVLPGLSCSALTAGILPLLASGHVTGDNRPRAMVFDRFCHFSMAYVKPICADEAVVLTSPHNDLNYLEDVCRRYPRVAYVADGAYSMGGLADVEGLAYLQDRYGMFLYFDDSHALSIHGPRGEGYVRQRLPLNPLTMVTASLGKAFGTAGGIAMLPEERMFKFLYRNGGPITWSQNMEVAAIGATLASAELHRTPELGVLQQRLQRNIAHFDRHFPTEHAGNGMPIRKITVGASEDAVQLSRKLYEAGYYCSAVFFPIVPRGEAGVRIMLRADMEPAEVERFCVTAKQIIEAF